MIPSPGYSTAAVPAQLLVNPIYKIDGREHPSLFGYNKITRGTLVWFAGLLVVDIANVLLAIHVAEESSTVSAIKEVRRCSFLRPFSQTHPPPLRPGCAG